MRQLETDHVTQDREDHVEISGNYEVLLTIENEKSKIDRNFNRRIMNLRNKHGLQEEFNQVSVKQQRILFLRHN